MAATWLEERPALYVQWEHPTSGELLTFAALLDGFNVQLSGLGPGARQKLTATISLVAATPSA
jgi:hypothetical protein